MKFIYIKEEPTGSTGNVNHYFYNKDQNIVIQSTEAGFFLREELWLKGYFQTVISGQELPGFSLHGDVEVSNSVVQPLIDGLNYKAHIEARLERVKKAVSIQGEQIFKQLSAPVVA